MVRHEQLWAPWRLSYVSGPEAGATASAAPSALPLLPGADPECFICRAVADDRDRENLLVRRSEHAVVILNRFPYNNGHLLVAPRLHKGRLDELNEHEQIDQQQLITHYVGQLERLMNAQGFNVGLNLGRTAGAGLPGHLHWHIVPRWSGDTNFMPVLAGARVIPQALEALWDLLSAAETGAEPPAR